MEISKKFNKPRLLVIGCGDVGMRLLPLVRAHYRVFAVTSQRERFAELRAAGAVPLLANLDQPESLRRLAGLAHHVVHLAPPPGEGVLDRRTRNVTAILPDRAQVVYVSTTGVYGDLGGRWADETQPVAPRNARALRRVDAEQVMRAWARRAQGRLAILRVPGIYAEDRLPLKRLEQGTPRCARKMMYSPTISMPMISRVLFWRPSAKEFVTVCITQWMTRNSKWETISTWWPIILACRAHPAWIAQHWRRPWRQLCCLSCRSRAGWRTGA